MDVASRVYKAHPFGVNVEVEFVTIFFRKKNTDWTLDKLMSTKWSPTIVINSVITPINNLINGYGNWGYYPYNK